MKDNQQPNEYFDEYDWTLLLPWYPAHVQETVNFEYILFYETMTKCKLLS